MPDFRVLECPAAYQLGTKTVAKPDLTTPDEFEGDDMRVVKLRSSVTTSGHTQDACELRQRRLLRFYTPQHPDTATPQEHQKRNCTPEPREQIRLREPWCPPRSFRLPAWQDHAHRVREGSISMFTKNRHSPGFPNEILTDFSYFCIVFHRFQCVKKRFRPLSSC